MRRRTAHDSDRVDEVTPHEMVQDLEMSIATRLSAAESARDDVARAQAQADALLAEAEVQAAKVGRVHAAAILAAARAEAARLADDGARAAADLTAAAARHRDDDVATVLARVLPSQVVS